jgi:hypothetical protein
MPNIARTALAATPIAAVPPNPEPAAAIAKAARRLLPDLERGRRIDAAMLRAAMERTFGGSDAEGAWTWKTAYDAREAATALFLRKFGPAMLARAASPAAMLRMLAKIAGLLPTHTRRSEQSQALQQFSTPITLGLAASTAAAITPADLVLEPSAGTRLLAILAELAGGALMLNELAETRAGLLARLFPSIPVTRFDAAYIHDHLDAGNGSHLPQLAGHRLLRPWTAIRASRQRSFGSGQPLTSRQRARGHLAADSIHYVKGAAGCVGFQFRCQVCGKLKPYSSAKLYWSVAVTTSPDHVFVRHRKGTGRCSKRRRGGAVASSG